MKILHVTNCFNAGVGKAVSSIAKDLSDHEHYLLWTYKNDSPSFMNDEVKNIFFSSVKWSHNFIQSILILKKLIKEINPDYIHLHSSFAGFIGRVFLNSEKIYYSSHGFAFQRKDIPFFVRRIFYLIERVLSHRTKRYVAFFPIDFKIASNVLKFKSISFYLYDGIIQICNQEKQISNSHGNNFVCIGRLSPAKDPKFMFKISEKIDKSLNIKLFWIGAHTQNTATKYWKNFSKNVEISNWQSDELVNEVISEAKAILVTSRWESGPLVLYESLISGTPLILRKIEAFEMFDFPQFRSIEEFCYEIELISFSEKYRKAVYYNQVQSIKNYYSKYLKNAKYIYF
jgi:hypothetical protein